MDADDLAGACRASHEWGVDQDERREWQAMLAAAIAGDVTLEQTDFGLWRLSMEARTIPEGATLHADVPRLDHLGEHPLVTVTSDELDALHVENQPAEPSSRLSDECRPTRRPHVGSVTEMLAFPRVQRAFGRRPQMRDPTPAEREAQQRAVAEWETAEAERTTRCADEIAAAEEASVVEAREAEEARRRLAAIAPAEGCPTLGDVDASWPIGTRCEYLVRHDSGASQRFPSYVSFHWEVHLDLGGCRVEHSVHESSDVRSLTAAVADIFESPLELAPTQTSWR